MKQSTLLKVAAASILKNKMRTLLTMLGIVIGVGAVIVMVAIGNGAQTGEGQIEGIERVCVLLLNRTSAIVSGLEPNPLRLAQFCPNMGKVVRPSGAHIGLEGCPAGIGSQLLQALRATCHPDPL